jgi:hypothetical protein
MRLDDIVVCRYAVIERATVFANEHASAGGAAPGVTQRMG